MMGGHRCYTPGRASKFTAGKHQAGGRVYGRKTGGGIRPGPEPVAVVMFQHDTAAGPRVVAFWKGRKIVGHTEKGCAHGLLDAGASPDLAWTLYQSDGKVMLAHGEHLSDV